MGNSKNNASVGFNAGNVKDTLTLDMVNEAVDILRKIPYPTIFIDLQGRLWIISKDNQIEVTDNG